MTGGIEETYDLKQLPNKQTFFDNLGNALAHDAMMVRKVVFLLHFNLFLSKVAIIQTLLP